jgi:hypothetical protein
VCELQGGLFNGPEMSKLIYRHNRAEIQADFVGSLDRPHSFHGKTFAGNVRFFPERFY